MESLSTAAMAVATLILKQALEQRGETLGAVVSQPAAALLHLMQRQNLPQSQAIAQAAQPIDVRQAVLALDAATQRDPALAQSVATLARAVQAEPTLAVALPAYAAALQTAPSATLQTLGELAASLPALQHVFQGHTCKTPVTFNWLESPVPAQVKSTPLTRQAQQNRQALLTKVKNFWVQGVLEQPLHEPILMTLGLEERPAAVAPPWNRLVETGGQAPKAIPAGTTVLSLGPKRVWSHLTDPGGTRCRQNHDPAPTSA